eukprot:PLAT12955.1.p1 GENE.PLAT12955.1~~PLAT12955.1.p1  ORF type:complete len:623 (-),score=163.97 PLAT12955.1:100-1968(-)
MSRLLLHRREYDGPAINLLRGHGERVAEVQRKRDKKLTDLAKQRLYRRKWHDSSAPLPRKSDGVSVRVDEHGRRLPARKKLARRRIKRRRTPSARQQRELASAYDSSAGEPPATSYSFRYFGMSEAGMGVLSRRIDMRPSSRARSLGAAAVAKLQWQQFHLDPEELRTQLDAGEMPPGMTLAVDGAAAADDGSGDAIDEHLPAPTGRAKAVDMWRRRDSRGSSSAALSTDGWPIAEEAGVAADHASAADSAALAIDVASSAGATPSDFGSAAVAELPAGLDHDGTASEPTRAVMPDLERPSTSPGILKHSAELKLPVRGTTPSAAVPSPVMEPWMVHSIPAGRAFHTQPPRSPPRPLASPMLPASHRRSPKAMNKALSATTVSAPPAIRAAHASAGSSGAASAGAASAAASSGDGGGVEEMHRSSSGYSVHSRLTGWKLTVRKQVRRPADPAAAEHEAAQRRKKAEARRARRRKLSGRSSSSSRRSRRRRPKSALPVSKRAKEAERKSVQRLRASRRPIAPLGAVWIVSSPDDAAGQARTAAALDARFAGATLMHAPSSPVLRGGLGSQQQLEPYLADIVARRGDRSGDSDGEQGEQDGPWDGDVPPALPLPPLTAELGRSL